MGSFRVNIRRVRVMTKKNENIIKEYLSDKHAVAKMASAVTIMSPSDQLHFLSLVMKQLSEDQKIKWADKAATIAYNQQWSKIENYMDSMFTKDISKTPRVIANHVLHYFKINKKMKPKILKLAQKVKHRVETRNRRKEQKSQS